MPPKKRRIAKKAEESSPKAPPEKKSKISKETPEVDFSELFASLALRILTTADGEASIASPSSICLTLAAAAAGARGSTKKEILDSIFGGAEESEINTFLRRTLRELTDITVANAIFVDESFETKQEYKRDLKKYFNAVVQSADFARNGDKEAEKINAYIRKKTKGLIQGLIPPDAISGGTRFVLANAVYLTAKFHDIFDEKDTKLRVFYNEDKTKKKVPTMTGLLTDSQGAKPTHTKQRTYSTANFEYIDFCIGKYHEFQFFIILPKKNSTCAQLKASLLDKNGISFSKIQEEAEPERGVHLELPKFKMEATFDLVPFLRGCGMQEAFSPAADFSGVSVESTHIDFAGHKAMFDVNEKGVTAAAATCCIAVAVSGYDRFQMIVSVKKEWALLRTQEAEFVSRKKCADYWESELHPNHVCMKAEKGLRKVGIFKGDSGGPLLQKINNIFYEVAIASFSEEKKRGPDVFTNAVKYCDFYEEITGENICVFD